MHKNEAARAGKCPVGRLLSIRRVKCKYLDIFYWFDT
jgi:hypothetical protein